MAPSWSVAEQSGKFYNKKVCFTILKAHQAQNRLRVGGWWGSSCKLWKASYRPPICRAVHLQRANFWPRIRPQCTSLSGYGLVDLGEGRWGPDLRNTIFWSGVGCSWWFNDLGYAEGSSSSPILLENVRLILQHYNDDWYEMSLSIEVF